MEHLPSLRFFDNSNLSVARKPSPSKASFELSSDRILNCHFDPEDFVSSGDGELQLPWELTNEGSFLSYGTTIYSPEGSSGNASYTAPLCDKGTFFNSFTYNAGTVSVCIATVEPFNELDFPGLGTSINYYPYVEETEEVTGQPERWEIAISLVVPVATLYTKPEKFALRAYADQKVELFIDGELVYEDYPSLGMTDPESTVFAHPNASVAILQGNVDFVSISDLYVGREE